jgi:cobalt-zinc-cadmium efflux system protein
VAPDDDCHLRRRELQAVLHERFGIGHTTLQVDHESWQPLVQIEGPALRS